jgi:hypothetical protein
MAVPEFDNVDHNWLYANDALLPYYREDGTAQPRDLRIKYIDILRKILNLNKGNAKARPLRFVDKSQSLTVRVGLVRSLLSEFNPRFVLIVRNPYALTWRAVIRDRIVSGLDRTEEEKFKLAVQHWRNSMMCALQDGEPHDLRWWRFEDLLSNPSDTLKQICAHAELSYEPSMLPGASDSIPWGSAYDAFNSRKWYPMRPSVSESYLRDMPVWAREHLERECSDLVELFGYSSPAGESRRKVNA